jgi:trimethylamine--corrinoid protein Co-methyltransferase
MIRLSVLEENEIEAIHQATLRILGETGVVLTEPKSRALLTAAGAKVQEKRVLLPPELVEKCIDLAGKKTSIRGRGGLRHSVTGHSIFTTWAVHRRSMMLLPEPAVWLLFWMYKTPPACWTRWRIVTPLHPFLHRPKCRVE